MQRSHKQNNYYWKCIVKILSSELGYYPHEIHDLLKREFMIDDTKTMERGEFNDYIEQIRIWSQTELGILLPTPEDLKNKM